MVQFIGTGYTCLDISYLLSLVLLLTLVLSSFDSRCSLFWVRVVSSVLSVPRDSGCKVMVMEGSEVKLSSMKLNSHYAGSCSI